MWSHYSHIHLKVKTLCICHFSLLQYNVSKVLNLLNNMNASHVASGMLLIPMCHHCHEVFGFQQTLVQLSSQRLPWCDLHQSCEAPGGIYLILFCFWKFKLGNIIFVLNVYCRSQENSSLDALVHGTQSILRKKRYFVSHFSCKYLYLQKKLTKKQKTEIA